MNNPTHFTMTSLEQLDVIDWELSLKLAGNKQEIAEELLSLLTTKYLPDELVKIKQAKEAQDYPELSRQLHKLHGAVCYCGTPRLKLVITILENALKQNDTSELEHWFNQFEIEVASVLEITQGSNRY